MHTILISVGIFLAAAAAHLWCCRTSAKKDLQAKLFIALAMLGLAVFVMAGAINQLPLLLSASVIYVLLVPVYLIFYVSTELVSPSKKIVQVLAAGPGAYSDLYKALERENFIMLRLEELEQSGCLRRDGERYCLTASGHAIAKTLGVYQMLLGREVGG